MHNSNNDNNNINNNNNDINDGNLKIIIRTFIAHFSCRT